MPLPLAAISWRLPALSSESGWAPARNGVNATVMHRLFVALRPPRAIREQLLATMAGVPGARWQDDEQLHLTLRFVGEVDRHLSEDLAAALGSVRHPPVAVSLDGVGSFMRGGRGAIWGGHSPAGCAAITSPQRGRRLPTSRPAAGEPVIPSACHARPSLSWRGIARPVLGALGRARERVGHHRQHDPVREPPRVRRRDLYQHRPRPAVRLTLRQAPTRSSRRSTSPA